MKLESSAFAHGEPIPTEYTGDGADVSPPLTWTGVPRDAISLVLIVDDPDAPDPERPQRPWTHWLLFNVPPSTTAFARGVRQLPEGTLQGVNDWHQTGYRGPYPSLGRHRYFFKLYAIDTLLLNLQEPTKAALQRAMQGHVLAEDVLMGTYERKLSARPKAPADRARRRHAKNGAGSAGTARSSGSTRH